MVSLVFLKRKGGTGGERERERACSSMSMMERGGGRGENLKQTVLLAGSLMGDLISGPG